MASIKDVAREAGVSVTTVSRIMNNRGPISDKTRKKVFKVMNDLDYRPNELARSLFKKRSKIIGLVIPYLDHPYFSKLAEAIEKECYNNDYKLLICTSEYTPAKEREIVSMLKAHKVDGLIFCSRSQNQEIYTGLELPAISIERSVSNIPSVCCDNYRGGVLAAQALIDGGCKYPMIIGHKVQSKSFPVYLRYQGFLEECERNGFNAFEFLIEEEDLMSGDFENNIDELIIKQPDIDGIFATSDVIAARTLVKYQESGRTTPKDFQLVGFDGIDISKYLKITTIAQPIKEMGEFSLDLLLKRIQGRMVPEQSVLPVTLIARNSTNNANTK